MGLVENRIFWIYFVLGLAVFDFQVLARLDPISTANQVLSNFDPDKFIDKAKEIANGKCGPDVKVFNVLEYGAKADGTTPSTINFIRAFKEACNHDGNAMLVIPKGEFVVGSMVLSGPCTSQAPLMIQVSGTIIAQVVSRMAVGADWIRFQSINGLILTGHGTFNGQGEKVWKGHCKGNNCIRMPPSLKFIKINDAIISGIRSVNAKGFHVMITICNNLRIFDVNISAPADSPNTDGIHMSKSNMVKISNCIIGTGDDCVSMIHGSTNVSVENVACGPGHGFSIGSLGHYDNEADVFGITVRNCSLTDTDNGGRIKTYKNDMPSKAAGIVFEDLVMTRVKHPIIIDQEYGKKGSCEHSRVSIHDVEFTNIRGTSSSPVAVSLICSKANPCTGITLKDINLHFEGRSQKNIPFSSNCTNVKVVYCGIQSPPPCA